MRGDRRLRRHREERSDRIPFANPELAQRLRQSSHLARQLRPRQRSPFSVLGCPHRSLAVGCLTRPAVHACVRDVQPRAHEPRRPFDSARGVEDVVPAPGERDPQVLDDCAPEPVGLLDRHAMQLGVAVALQHAREPGHVRRSQLFGGRVPREVTRYSLASLGWHAEPDLRRGESEVADARLRLVRSLHDHARQHGGERRPAVDSAGSRRRSLRAAVDRHRLCADVRLADARGRQGRRRVRPSKDLRHGDRRLHDCIASLRARDVVPDAHRRSRPAGGRRRPDEPRDALDHRGDVSAPRTRNRDRDLGRHLCAGSRHRSARGRSHHGARRLELDLLRQHPDRRDRNRGQLPLHRRVARRDPCEPRSARAR